MDLFVKFKKDYFNYLISIILPAFISGASIPVFKHLLGASGYGNFSIWFNAILISTAILSGWIAQSIILFFPLQNNKQVFSKAALLLSARTQSLFFLPVLAIVWYISHDFFLAFLCATVLFVTAMQFVILPIIQSSFLSKKIIYSETIRVVTYVGGAICLVKFSPLPYLYSLFIAVIVSYSFSLIYLLRQSVIFFRSNENNFNETRGENHVFKKFFKYGAPLSLWFVFAFMLSYIDKLFILKNLGAEVQGNYQAIFDFLSKSIILIISPIVTSIFPILTAAYSKGDRLEIKRLLKKIALFELAGFTITSILYWWFGATLLLKILKTPDTFNFRFMGFIVIAGTFIWQIAILVQKRFELKLRSLYLLKMVIVAFTCQVIFYLVFKDSANEQIYPLGFLLSAIIYLFLISGSQLILYSKKLRLTSRSFSSKARL
ncbi:MAG: hypothetical protein M3015_16920 [Bacteroidota bacterium]|nr:hypothetical protein [Bacteroidota bacterium]